MLTDLYIAYGSNLNIEQMKRRCPTAGLVGAATLEDYELKFMGPHPYGCVATVEPKTGSSVPVLVWKLKKQDEKNLDVYEGYPNLYYKDIFDIEIEGKIQHGMIYLMCDNPSHVYGLPSLTYLQVICKGYTTAHFDFAPLFYGAYKLRKEDYFMMTPTIRDQILAVRDTGETNMFDVNTVQYIANREGYYDLVCYLEENRREYSNFIMTGEAPMTDEEDMEG